MIFEDKDDKLKVSFNELEINNELMAENLIKWLFKKELIRQNNIFLCKWQSIKNPTVFQDKRGYLSDTSLKDKIVKTFSIKLGETTYYFAIFKINQDNFTTDFVLKYCFMGQLFFISKNQQCDIVLEELKNNIQKDDSLNEKLNNNDLTNYFDMECCQLLLIEQVDNPITGINIFTYSIIHF